jgi:transcriptional regulator with XRE-family HTH domain
MNMLMQVAILGNCLIIANTGKCLIREVENIILMMLEYLGTVIKSKRIEAEISTKNLADLANCDVKYLREIERGTKTPSLKMLDKIFKALNIEPFKDLPFFDEVNCQNFITKIAPLVPKLSTTDLKGFAEMMRIAANKDELPSL